jgi:hypothetical protein
MSPNWISLLGWLPHFIEATDLAFDPQGNFLASICTIAASELIGWDLAGLDVGRAEE